MTGNSAFILWFLIAPFAMAWLLQRSVLRFVRVSAWVALAVWLAGLGGLVFIQQRCGTWLIDETVGCDGLTTKMAVAIDAPALLAASVGAMALPALCLLALLVVLIRRQ